MPETPVDAPTTPAPPRTAAELVFAGESGAVAFEYALVTAAVTVPLTIVVLYVFQVLLDMYRATMLVLNLPWP